MSEQPPPRTARKPLKQAIEENAPYLPPQWDPADASAIKALSRGDAPEHLQRRALDFIINRLCGTYDLPYRPGGPEGDRDTAFACGKQFVGQQLVKLLHVKTTTEGEQP